MLEGEGGEDGAWARAFFYLGLTAPHPKAQVNPEANSGEGRETFSVWDLGWGLREVTGGRSRRIDGISLNQRRGGPVTGSSLRDSLGGLEA